MDAHTASLDAHMYCRYEGAPAGHIENGRWPGGAPLSAVVVHSAHSRLGLDEGASMPRARRSGGVSYP